LQHLYRGEAWPLEEVLKRKAEIEAAGLIWSVVESIPVHNSIKLRTGSFRQFTEAWKDSLAATAKAGIKIVCYTLCLGWTGLGRIYAGGCPAPDLRCASTEPIFAAYDLFLLQRPSAEQDYPAERIAAARARYEAMPETGRDDLERTIIAGLPGAEASYTRTALLSLLSEYKSITGGELRAHLIAFFAGGRARRRGAGRPSRIHPDDPPWSLFGLPRVVSTAEDVRAILAGVDSPANGLTFCVGSYGARADNDLLAMVKEFAPRIISRISGR